MYLNKIENNSKKATYSGLIMTKQKKAEKDYKLEQNKNYHNNLKRFTSMCTELIHNAQETN